VSPVTVSDSARFFKNGGKLLGKQWVRL